MKTFFITLAFLLSVSAHAEGQWKIECRQKDSSQTIKGLIEFDSVGWSAIALKLDSRKLKVFQVFRAGEGNSLSFVDRSEYAGATNSYSYFSIIVVISKVDRSRFVNGDEFRLKLLYRDIDSVTGAASFSRSSVLRCEPSN